MSHGLVLRGIGIGHEVFEFINDVLALVRQERLLREHLQPGMEGNLSNEGNIFGLARIWEALQGNAMYTG